MTPIVPQMEYMITVLQMIKDGIAELLDEDFVVEDMPKKEESKPDPVYIPIPVAAEYFYGELKEEEENITKQKNK